MFENVTSFRREPNITFVQEITKHILLLIHEIKQYFFNDCDAQACIQRGIHSLLSLMIYLRTRKT